jgi:hypothetical protein
MVFSFRTGITLTMTPAAVPRWKAVRVRRVLAGGDEV